MGTDLFRPQVNWLNGLTIVDTTLNLPGPVAGHLLAALGAAVIKVDPPQGDPTSAFPRLYEAINSSKQRAVVDFKHPQDYARFIDMVAKADGILVGMRGEALKKLRLDFETLRKVNPKLIYCHVTGFPSDSAAAGSPGHDLTYLAKAGLLSLLFPHHETPTQLADMTGALYTALLWLAALHHRTQSGEGTAIEVNLYESPSLLGLVAHTEPGLAAVLAGQCICYRCYKTSDGTIALGALEPKFFERLSAALKHPEWASHGFTPAVEGNAVFEALSACFRERTTAEWMEFGLMHDIPLENVETQLQLPAMQIPLR